MIAIQELLHRKTGRPLLVTEELDIQIQEYIKELRKHGLAINTSIIIASERGIIMNKDAICFLKMVVELINKGLGKVFNETNGVCEMKGLQ